jgi:hypothetical protein
VVLNDVSVPPVGLTFKGQAVQEESRGWRARMYTRTGSPKTSFSHRLTPRNNSEDGIIHFNRGESLTLRTFRLVKLISAVILQSFRDINVSVPANHSGRLNH